MKNILVFFDSFSNFADFSSSGKTFLSGYLSSAVSLDCFESIVDFSAYEETIEALKTTSHNYVITIEGAPEFPQLYELLNQQYEIETVIDGATIYKKTLFN